MTTAASFTDQTSGTISPLLVNTVRIFGLSSVLLGVVFVINNFLIFGFDLPGFIASIGGEGALGTDKPEQPFGAMATIFGWVQTLLVLLAVALPGVHVMRGGSLAVDAAWMDALASYLVRAAFWAVLLTGITDAVISFLRVENLHAVLFGEKLATQLGLSSWRGVFVHLPMILLAGLIALRDKSVSVVWLTLLVVIAEMLIVLARFIFAYEQTFMGDLVRFWYAALFLFASAYTLKEEGHVRVDVLYAGLRQRTKCWLNFSGSLLFGLPLCWIVMARGMWGKSSLINSPMFNFETSMSGFGMYVKYLMAAFLIVFALTMLIQFTAYMFASLAELEDGTADRADAKAAEAGGN